MHHLLNRVCSHNVFPCIISAICSSCQILITDAPAKQSMAKHEDQVTKAAYLTTPKSSLGNYVLHSFRHTAVYPSDQLSLSSATPRRKKPWGTENAMTVIPDGNVTPLRHYVDCKWEALSGATREEIINQQLWEGVVKRHCSVDVVTGNIGIDLGFKAILLAYNECSNR